MTQLFKFDSNIRYFHPEIPEDISSVSVYGRDLNYGEAFAYLYRRFGDSSDRKDEYKDLGVYYLSTSLDSVVLTVFPHHETYPFKCLVGSDIRKRLYQEREKITKDFEQRFADWCKENNKVVFSRHEWENTPEQLEYLGNWLTNNDLAYFTEIDSDLPKEIADRFLADCQREFMAVRNHYFDNVENLCDISGNLHKDIQSALIVTIRDLLTPVNIRDWEINILGKV